MQADELIELFERRYANANFLFKSDMRKLLESLFKTMETIATGIPKGGLPEHQYEAMVLVCAQHKRLARVTLDYVREFLRTEAEG